jgi:hypothetical protein
LRGSSVAKVNVNYNWDAMSMMILFIWESIVAQHKRFICWSWSWGCCQWLSAVSKHFTRELSLRRCKQFRQSKICPNGYRKQPRRELLHWRKGRRHHNQQSAGPPWFGGALGSTQEVGIFGHHLHKNTSPTSPSLIFLQIWRLEWIKFLAATSLPLFPKVSVSLLSLPHRHSVHRWCVNGPCSFCCFVPSMNLLSRFRSRSREK